MLNDLKFESKSIYSDQPDINNIKPSLTPVYNNAAFYYDTAEEIENIFAGRDFGFLYSRISNPTILSFEKKLSNLENGIGCIATSSGMAAITTTLLALLQKDNEIICSKNLFGGTIELFNNVLSKFGITIKYVNITDIDEIKNAITENTKLIFFETISNPNLIIPDICGIVNLAKKNNIPVIVDSTVTTPYLFNGKKFGVSIVIHSTTKYITGNSSIIGGALIDTGNYDWTNYNNPDVKKFAQRFGHFAFISHAKKYIYQNIGVSPAPFNVYLQNLGIETLALRMEKHSANALKLAEFLTFHKNVKKVYYPLLDKEQIKYVKKYFNNLGGGIVSFELENKEAAFKFINNLKLAKNMTNIGDTRTLVLHPASTIFADFSSENKIIAGAYDNLVRVSVGLENINDIINDFERGLNKN